MTLNTFHLAGHGGANVTLGIPRLREILMTASENIKTPMMTLNLVPGLSDEKIEAFANRFKKLLMSEIVKSIEIEQDLKLQKNECLKEFKIKVSFEDLSKVNKNFLTNFEDLKKAFLSKFVPLLILSALKQSKKGA